MLEWLKEGPVPSTVSSAARPVDDEQEMCRNRGFFAVCELAGLLLQLAV